MTAIAIDTRIPVRVSRHYECAPERVFDAWLDARNVGRWLFVTPTGKMKSVQLDPRVGGSFTLTESRPEGEAEHHGQYLEITRPRRLVFTFSSLRHAVDVDPVMVEITPAPEGGCDLVLVHEMQGRWADYRDRTRQGWAAILEGLGRHLA
ncbi:MAG: SRPBCC family protein [Pseudomonadota bacterium]